MKTICVAFDSQGYVYATDSQDIAVNCPYQITETGNQQIELYPFNLTMEEGAVIAGAILGVWVIGFSFRQLRRVMY